MLAWAVAAAALGLSPAGHLVVVVAALLLLAPFAAVRPARRVLHRSGVVGPLLLAALLVAVLQVAAAGHGILRARGGVEQLASERAAVTAVAVVTGDPIVLAGRGDRPVVLREATMLVLDARGLRRDTSAPVLLTGDPAIAEPGWRSTVRVRGRLGPTDPADDRVATLSVSGAPQVLESPGAVASAAERLRAGLRSSLDHAPPDARGLLPGLVIGDTSRTPEDLTAAMRATGMTHLTAVSGSNVAVVTGLVLGLCVVAGVPRRWRPVLALVALAGFVVLARPEPSVVRAAAMGAIGLIGLSRSRRSAGPPVLGAAIVVVLLLDPWLARSFGFALSSLATLGLLLFTRPWGDAIGARLPGRLAPLGPALAIPVAAQAMTAPLVVLLQGSVSVVGVLANLLAAPLVPVATVAGVAAALMSVVWDRGAVLVAWAGVVPTTGHRPGRAPVRRGARRHAALARRGAGRRAARGAQRRPPALRPCARVRGHGPPDPRHRRRPGRRGGARPTRTVTWPPDGWRVVVCDVGQGDAVVLRSGPHRAVLVDAGPDPPLVDRCLYHLGVTTLDAVVLTHFHADHVDGLSGAVDGRAVAQLLVGPVREPAASADQVERVARAHGIPVAVLHAGDRLAVGEVAATVWSPARRIPDGSVPNNASVVLAARVGTVDALLLGDVEREAAHDLLLRMRREPAMALAAAQFEVVKTPHHGSANLDDDLMAAVAAPVGVISVGKDNDYGHPAPHHLDVLRRNGFAVYRTDQRGDVAVVEHGGAVAVETER